MVSHASEFGVFSSERVICPVEASEPCCAPLVPEIPPTVHFKSCPGTPPSSLEAEAEIELEQILTEAREETTVSGPEKTTSAPDKTALQVKDDQADSDRTSDNERVDRPSQTTLPSLHDHRPSMFRYQSLQKLSHVAKEVPAESGHLSYTLESFQSYLQILHEDVGIQLAFYLHDVGQLEKHINEWHHWHFGLGLPALAETTETLRHTRTTIAKMHFVVDGGERTFCYTPLGPLANLMKSLKAETTDSFQFLLELHNLYIRFNSKSCPAHIAVQAHRFLYSMLSYAHFYATEAPFQSCRTWMDTCHWASLDQDLHGELMKYVSRVRSCLFLDRPALSAALRACLLQVSLICDAVAAERDATHPSEDLKRVWHDTVVLTRQTLTEASIDELDTDVMVVEGLRRMLMLLQ